MLRFYSPKQMTEMLLHDVPEYPLGYETVWKLCKDQIVPHVGTYGPSPYYLYDLETSYKTLVNYAKNKSKNTDRHSKKWKTYYKAKADEQYGSSAEA